MNKIHKKTPKDVKKEPETVTVTPSMNRNGYIELNFNKKMKVPDFGGGSSGRVLGASNNSVIALSNLDVQRDILNLDFILKN